MVLTGFTFEGVLATSIYAAGPWWQREVQLRMAGVAGVGVALEASKRLASGKRLRKKKKGGGGGGGGQAMRETCMEVSCTPARSPEQ